MRLGSSLALAIVVVAALPAGAAASAGSSSASELQRAPGRVVLPIGPSSTSAAVRRDGRIVVAGVSDAGQLQTAELLPSGALSTAYGDRGLSTPAIALAPKRIFAMPDGRLLVFGPRTRWPASRELSPGDWRLARLNADGRVDPSFGRGGVVELPLAPGTMFADAQPGPDGSVVVGSDAIVSLLRRVATLVRIRPDGSLDSSFGTGGVYAPPLANPELKAFFVLADGAVVLLAASEFGTPAARSLVMKLTATGRLDPAFGGGSPIVVDPGAADAVPGAGGTIGLLVLAPDGHFTVARITADGRYDEGWGAGVRPDLGAVGHAVVLPEPDGGLVLARLSERRFIQERTKVQQIVRVTASRQLDPAVGGARGAAVDLPFRGGRHEPHGIADLKLNGFVPAGVIRRADGRLLFFGEIKAWVEHRVPDADEADIRAQSSGVGVAGLGPGYALDPSFGGASSLRVGARIESRRLRASGIVVRLRSSSAAMSVVTLRAGGRTIARASIPFFVPVSPHRGKRFTSRVTTRIALTRAGRRLLPWAGSLHVTLRVAAADLAGNDATASAWATLRRSGRPTPSRP